MFLIHTKGSNKPNIVAEYESIMEKTFENEDHMKIIGKGGKVIAEKKPEDTKFKLV